MASAGCPPPPNNPLLFAHAARATEGGGGDHGRWDLLCGLGLTAVTLKGWGFLKKRQIFKAKPPTRTGHCRDRQRSGCSLCGAGLPRLLAGGSCGAQPGPRASGSSSAHIWRASPGRRLEPRVCGVGRALGARRAPQARARGGAAAGPRGGSGAAAPTKLWARGRASTSPRARRPPRMGAACQGAPSRPAHRATRPGASVPLLPEPRALQPRCRDHRPRGR